MSDIAIRVENLSKEYRIGSHQNGDRRFGYKSLRDVLTDALAAPWRRASRLLRGEAYAAAEMNETIWALKDVSFEIKRGEVLGIIGRNGAGKSTLLKILSRITQPTHGEVTIYGRVGSLLEVGTGFHPELTGRENIYLNGAILGMKRAEIVRQFDEIVAFAEVEKFIDTPVKHYSSGMYLRLAFAVAAHLNPDILVVDEVLAVGDIEFQKKCLGKMQDVTKKGRTVLFVSHNMGAIRILCEKVLWIEKGQVLKIGGSTKVINEYEKKMIGVIDSSLLVSERSYEEAAKLKFYIKSVGIFNVKGEPTNIFKYNEKILLIINFSDYEIDTAFSPEFYIYNELGILVALGASAPYHGKYFSKKVRRIKVEIGPLFVTSGKYSILLSVIVGHKRMDTWENAIGFTINECKPFRIPEDIPARSNGVCVIQYSFDEMA